MTTGRVVKTISQGDGGYQVEGEGGFWNDGEIKIEHLKYMVVNNNWSSVTITESEDGSDILSAEFRDSNYRIINDSLRYQTNQMKMSQE